MNTRQQLSTRPWTVTALVVLGILGAIRNQVFSDVFDAKDILSIGVAILFAWGLWNARRWAYVLTIIGAGLSTAILAVYVFGNLGSIGAMGKLIWFVDIAAAWYLVLHRKTRAFFAKLHHVIPSREEDLRRP